MMTEEDRLFAWGFVILIAILIAVCIGIKVVRSMS
jgi:uncharacterized protein YpmS